MNKELRLSPSSINTFLRSPRLFYYQYILGMKSPPNIHLYKGSFVHGILEDLFSGGRYIDPKVYCTTRMNDWNPPQAIIQHMKEGETEENHRNETAKILQVFATRLTEKIEMILLEGKARDKNHAWNLIKPKLREHKIFDTERNVVGIIDSVETNFDDEVYVMDYKTSKLYKNTMSTEYVRQIAIYAYLFKKEFGKLPQYVGINYLRYGETYMIPLWIMDGKLGEMLEAQAIADIEYVRKNTVSTNIEDYPKGNDEFANQDIEYFEKKLATSDSITLT